MNPKSTWLFSVHSCSCRWRCIWTDAGGDAHGQMQMEMHMDRCRCRCTWTDVQKKCACVCAHVHDADFRDQTVVP